nr:hypothetical protein [Cressdnaviricota sp.]
MSSTKTLVNTIAWAKIMAVPIRHPRIANSPLIKTQHSRRCLNKQTASQRVSRLEVL